MVLDFVVVYVYIIYGYICILYVFFILLHILYVFFNILYTWKSFFCVEIYEFTVHTQERQLIN